MPAQFSDPSFSTISVAELAQRLAGSPQDVQLVDVREPHEVAIASLPTFENLPLSQYSEWADTIATRFDPHAETLVMCHHGMRSAQMCQWLVNQGFTNVKNVEGGIDAYSIVVDPSVPRY